MPIAQHQTPIGMVRVTQEDNFISAVYFVDSRTEIIPPDTLLLKLAVLQLDEYFAGKRRTFDFPIKQQGSDFQQQVWQCLLRIDYGKTVSYAHQSKLMNNPLAIRAIAAANGQNHLAVVVPCHRVIGSNGKLTGYAGGLWRKKWLLEHEAQTAGYGQATLF